MKEIKKIAFGGGCHWCTEAVFQSLKGVSLVEQGFIASGGIFTRFSEAVIVHFDPEIITQDVLVEIHLLTHKSTSEHSLREKYRSAVYTFENDQFENVKEILKHLQSTFEKQIITRVLPFEKFRCSPEKFKNYYLIDPEKPFCKKYIDPKLKKLFLQFSSKMKNV